MNQVTLEERICKCGCGMRFKVMPTSPCQYASSSHQPGYETPAFSKNPDLRYIRKVCKWLDEVCPTEEEPIEVSEALVRDQ